MAIFLLVIIVCIGIAVSYRLLSPYMYLPIKMPVFNFSRLSRFTWKRAALLPDSAGQLPQEQPVVPVELPVIDEPLHPEDIDVPVSLPERLTKTEALLVEKNRTIERLQKELEAERSHRLAFESVKDALDLELARLKDRIRELKKPAPAAATPHR